MPFPLDPTFQKTGKPFLTVSDGTTAPDNAGDAVDLTGVPITVAPQTNAVQSGVSATISAFGASLLTVDGLHDMAPESVGRLLTLFATAPGNRGTFPIAAVLSKTSVQVTDAGGQFPDVNSGTTATISAFATNFVTLTGLSDILPEYLGRELTVSGCATVGNNGTFEIIAVLSDTSLVVFNTAGAFPDANSGAITWVTDSVPFRWVEALDPNAFPPGDPLSYLVEQATPFINDQKTFGPARGGGSAILPPNQNVLPGGELGTNSLPERVGKGGGALPPIVPPGTVLPGTGATVGPVVATDPQFPVVFAPNSSFVVNRDISSLAFGQAPVLDGGPTVQTPEVVVPVPAEGVEAAKFKARAIAYPEANPVTFSRS